MFFIKKFNSFISFFSFYHLFYYLNLFIFYFSRFQRRKDVWSVWVVEPASVPPYAPQPYVDPEVLMDQLKDKDDRIAALEQKMADQEGEATRKQNEQMMEMMKRMYPNKQFP
ncbi:hypothetical protein YC2023_078366 [Brassica napus]